MSFIRSLPSSERVPMKIGRMAFLRGHQSSREMLTKGSEDSLTCFAVVHPDLGRGLFKYLARLGDGVKSVVFPQALLEIQNLKIVARFNTDPAFAKSLLTPEGAVDFTKAGVKRQPEVRDLTADFEDFKLLNELKKSFEDETNLKIINADPEIRDLNLAQDLWITRALLYCFEEQKKAAKKDGNETLACECRASIIAVADYLVELAEKFPLEGILEKIPEEFPYGENAPEAKIKRAAELLIRGNTSPVDNSLRKLTEKLDKEIILLKKERLSREWKFRKPYTRQPSKLIEETLVHLAKRRHKISFSPDGMWTIPQGGFMSAGVVKQKHVIDHRVREDKVVRREQHKLDNISQQVSINANFIVMLDGFARAMRDPGEVDYEQLKNGLDKSYLAYEKGIVTPKFRTRLFVKVALKLVKTAEGISDEKAKGGLLKFASDMCEMASHELVELNKNLGEQINRIVPKQELLRAIVLGNLVRDANIRLLSESVRIAIVNRRIMNDSQFAWIVRQQVIKAKDSLKMDDQTEEGIKSCIRRLNVMSNLLAMIARLNGEKEKGKICKDFLEARKKFKIDGNYLIARGDWDKVAETMRTSADYEKEKIKAIADINNKIKRALETIVKESLLMVNDIEHKHEKRQYADPKMKEEILSKQQQEVIQGNEAEFEEVRKLNAGYLPVYRTIAVKEPLTKKWEYRSVAIGEALPKDILVLGLNTIPAYPVIS